MAYVKITLLWAPKKAYVIDFISLMIAKAENINRLFSMVYIPSGNRWMFSSVSHERGCIRKMAARQHQPLPSLLVHETQPLIGIPCEENGQEGVRYFTDEQAADAAVSDSTTRAALSVIGAWRDLDWEEMVEALDQMRHESKPTPPIEL